MRTNARRTAISAAVILSISVVAAGVLAATQSSDEQALAPTRPAASRSIERKVDDLLAKMTTQEKLQQVQLLADWQATDDEAKAGLGGVFSLTDPDKINHLQHVAVEESRLHIPILFAFDTIHGYRTVFPIPLGAASSFDPDVAPAGGAQPLRHGRAAGGPPGRRTRDPPRRHQADLQPDGRPPPRAALGPHR